MKYESRLVAVCVREERDKTMIATRRNYDMGGLLQPLLSLRSALPQVGGTSSPLASTDGTFGLVRGLEVPPPSAGEPSGVTRPSIPSPFRLFRLDPRDLIDSFLGPSVKPDARP